MHQQAVVSVKRSILLSPAELPEAYVRWLWANPKPRSTWRRHAIAFHQLNLISGNGRAREKFGYVSDRVPECEGKGQQKGSVARRGGKRSQQRSISINAGARQLVDLIRDLHLQYACARLANVLDIGRLDSRAAISTHREYRL